MIEQITLSRLLCVEILIGLEEKNFPEVVNKSIIKFNYTLLLAKYYLYTQTLLKHERIRKLTSKFQIERLG